MANESTLLHNVSPEQFRALLSEIVERVQNHFAPPPPGPVHKELMTLEEVAEHFKKNQGTIINWTKKKYLTKYGIGRAVYYKREEVESAVIPM